MSETKKLGRPRKILDPEKIAQFIGKGYTNEWVADYFDVHVDTLYANYSDALRKGKVFRNGCLRAKQYHSAMVKGNIVMQIWLGKQDLGQSDKNEVKATVKNDLPDYSGLTNEQLAQVRAIVDSAGSV